MRKGLREIERTMTKSMFIANKTIRESNDWQLESERKFPGAEATTPWWSMYLDVPSPLLQKRKNRKRSAHLQYFKKKKKRSAHFSSTCTFKTGMI